MAEKNLVIPDLLDIYGELLTENQRKMTEYYYCDDLSLGEIAENENISRQGTRDTVKRAETQLLEYEKKLHILENDRALNLAIDKIRKLFENSEQYEKIEKILDELQNMR